MARTLAAFALASSALFGQVVLNPSPTPAAAAAGAVVQLKGKGFPAGAIASGNLLVTITPPSGNGAPVTVPASALIPANAAPATLRTIIFTVPTSLTSNSPLLCSITVASKAATSPSFSTTTAASFTVNPPPTLIGAYPGAGTLGTSIPVKFVSNGFTHFGSSSTISFLAPNGGDPTALTVTGINVPNSNELDGTLNISSNATVGSWGATITTGTESATGSLLFVVSSSNAADLSLVNPSGGALGQTLDVALTGSFTNFQSGVSYVNFGPGITVNTFSVADATDASANITISPTTYAGARTVTVVTGGQYAQAVNGFTVGASAATLVSVNPNAAAQGAVLTGVTVTGANTHFLQGATQLSFGGGISVGAINVLSSTQFQVDLAVTSAAAPGNNYTATVTTGGEVESLGNAFTVTGATPILTGVSPSSAAQGDTLNLNISGQYTNFQTGNVTLSFGGSDITVNSLTVNSTTSITANITVAQTAATGGRQVILTSGGTDFPFNFNVAPSSAHIVSVTPSTFPQGFSQVLQVVGSNTNWVQGETNAVDATPPEVLFSVDRITVNSPTSLTLNITVPANATIGGHDLQVSTGGQILNATVTVYGQTATMQMSPANSTPGALVPVSFTGQFTHWCSPTSTPSCSSANQTTVAISNQGVNLSNFTITSPSSATALLTVTSTAPLTNPIDLNTFRTITLTTPLAAGGSEIVTSEFAIYTNPAGLYSMTPDHAPPSSVVNVEIVGVGTHFQGGVTTLDVGPNIAVSNLVVNSATDFTATLTLDANAQLGWRTAFVNTISNTLTEELQIGFRVDGPAAPVVTSVSPNTGIQGQTLNVTVTGANTNWVQGQTELILGADITINNLVITSPTTANASISISPTAPSGGQSVIMLTGEEADSGSGFSVQQGDTSVVSSTDAATPVGQNFALAGTAQTLNIAITGVGTHWLQGGTSAQFGFDGQVVVDALTITSPTTANAVVTILTGASLGFRPLTMTTGGEQAMLQQAMDVEELSPKILSSNPGFGLQATTFNVQVLGQATHWQTGVTVPTFTPNGAGITVNSFTAFDSSTGIVNVTIDPLAFPTNPPGCATLNLTTIQGAVNEQVSLIDALCIAPGAATVLNVTNGANSTPPASAPQGETTTVQINGLDTHWVQGVTVAAFDGGINAANVNVTSPTTATVDLAVPTNATVGFHPVVMTTLGERASLQQAFQVIPATATLNQVSPATLQQGQSVANATILGQFTHWDASTTVSFGLGVTASNCAAATANSITCTLSVDSLAFVGPRTVIVDTPDHSEQVTNNSIFSVTQGPAIISNVAPASANQGQRQLPLQILGTNTHWQQGLTRFSIGGEGGDIAVNGVIINSPTQATAYITVSPTAGLGPRSVSMVSAGEILTNANSVVITGGIPSISYLNPGFGVRGTTALAVEIHGLLTAWTQGTTTVDFGAALGSGVTVTQLIVNNDTDLTAVVNVDANAPVAFAPVTVRNTFNNFTQVLTSSFQVINPAAPPTPQIWYMDPNSGLPGQTINVALGGYFTHWDPNPDPSSGSSISFGAGVTVNSFSVTSPTSALANITIDPAASAGPRTVTLTTPINNETETTTFSVVIATPVITIVNPNSQFQGGSITVNVLGEYTAWDSTTVFSFGPGVNVTSTNVVTPDVAQITVSVDQLAQLGGRQVSATTGAEVDHGGFFDVTPSLATLVSVTPNAGLQGATALPVAVVGQNTHWDSSTVFTFGDGIAVSGAQVTSPTTATMNLAIPPLASVGATSLTASTGGEIATLVNGFVVQPGTPIVLSSAPNSIKQQQDEPLTILGQVTNWQQGQTVVTLGPGFIADVPQVTSPTALTVHVTANPLTFPGCYGLQISTGSQTLGYPNALCVQPGPAVITNLSPASALQGQTLTIHVIGQDTHWAQGVTTANFGQGVSVNTITVDDATDADVNITIGALANPQFNTVTFSTQGESASITGQLGLQIIAATPILTQVIPNSGVQGQTLAAQVSGLFTHFGPSTVFNFGPYIQATTLSAPPAVGFNFPAINNAALGSLAIAGSSQPNQNFTAEDLTKDGQTNTSGALWYAGVVNVGGGFSTTFTFKVIGNGAQTGDGLAFVVETPGNLAPFPPVNGTGLGVGALSPNPQYAGLAISLPTTSSGSSDLYDCGANVALQVAPACKQTSNASLASQGINLADGNLHTVTIAATAAGAYTVQIDNSAPYTDNALALALLDNTDAYIGLTASADATNSETVEIESWSLTSNQGPSSIDSSTLASVQLQISPLAVPGTYPVTATTPLGGGNNEVAAGVSFTINPGPAAIASVLPGSGHQNQNGLQVTIAGNGFTHFAANSVVNLGSGVSVTNEVLNGDGSLTVTVNISPFAPVQTNNVSVTTGGEIAALANGFTVLSGAPVLTSANPTTVHQGATVQLTVNGLFTHLDAGITGATFSPNDVNFVNVQSGSTATQAVITVQVSNTAALVAHSVTIFDSTDGSASGTGLFTVAPGIAAVASLSPNGGAQGSSQQVIINGNAFTHFSASSVVGFSGSGVTASAVQFNSPNQLTATVSVANGTLQGGYAVTVTTGAEQATLANAFQVLPGVATIQGINLNVGVQNSNQTVTINGAFTNFQGGQTTANFGPFVGVGGQPAGVAGPVQVNSPTNATANLVIAPGATLGAYNVTITDPTDGNLTVTNGFTIQASSPVAPQIMTVVPPYGATAVPTNASFTFELNEPIQNANTGNVILFDQNIGGFNCSPNVAAVVPGTVSTDASGRIVTFTPGSNLKVGTGYIVCIDGGLNNYTAPGYNGPITSQGGTPQNLPYNDYAFNTGFGPALGGPQFTFSNILSGDTAVATNAVVTIGFNQPVNPTTVTAADFFVTQSGNPVPGAISYNSSFTQFTFTPATAFAANTAYVATYTNGIADWTDAALSNPGTINFTTAAGPNTTAIRFVTWTPRSSEQTGLNPTVSFTMSGPVNPLSITPGTFYVYNQGTGWIIPGSAISFSNNNRTVTLTLPGLLDPGTDYFWQVNGYDRDGNHFSGDDYFQTLNATTGDAAAPTVVQEVPSAGNSGAPLNPLLQVLMNKNIDWNSLASSTLTLSPAPVQALNCAAVSGNLVANCGFETGNLANWTPTGNSSARVATNQPHSGSYIFCFCNDSPAGTISQTITDAPNTTYTLTFYLSDQGTGSPVLFQALWNGTPVVAIGPSIATAFGWTPYTVTVTSSGSGSDTLSFTGFNNPGYFFLDDISLTNQAQGGVLPAVQLGADNQTVSFAGALLAANASYSATVAGLKDVDSNAMSPFQWTFSTGAAAQVINSPDTASIAPAYGASNIAPAASVVYTLSNPVDPSSVSNGSLPVWDNTVGGTGSNHGLPGAYAISTDGKTITFTPSQPFQGGHQICAFVNSNPQLLDSAGNPFNNPESCFTIAAATDSAAPSVLSITPGDGSTGLGPYNPITILFSEPMSPNSFGGNNIAIYQGTTLVTGNSGALSRDLTSYTFTPSLSYGTTYTVVVTPGVTDLASNHLPAQVTSSFTTMPRPPTSGPTEQVNIGCNLCVTGFRPGSGATNVTATNPLTFFISGPLNPASVVVGTASTSGTLYVAQNGVLIDGTVALSSNNQVIVFTPAGSTFTPGAAVTAFLTSGITDPVGNPLGAYAAGFTVAAATTNTPPLLAGATPTAGGQPVNTVVDVRFTQPILPATATSSNFYVLANNSLAQDVAGSITPLNGGKLLRFAPNSPFAANTCFYAYLTSGLTNTTGQPYAGSNSQFAFSFCTNSATAVAGGVRVASAEPTNGSASIGTNALLRVVFTGPIEPLSVDSSTLTLTANGNPVPYTFSYSSGDGNVGFGVDGPNQLVLTPQAPLPAGPGTTIAIGLTNGISDPFGQPVAATTVSFTTATAPNFSQPQVVASSVGNNDVNVPVGSVFTLTFNEPMDTRSFQYGNTVYLRDAQFGNTIPAVQSYTPDGTQVTVAPIAPLAADRPYYIQTCSVYDLTGNRMNGCFTASFTTALLPVAPLSLLSIVPPDASTAVDTNIRPTLQFNHPISEPSAAANITLTQGGVPVPVNLNFSSADSIVTIAPVAMLKANLPYQITVNGGAGGLVDAAAASQPLSLVASLATGETAPGVPLAYGAGDSNWIVTGPNGTGSAAKVLSPGSRYSAWSADDTNSQWIGVQDSVAQPPAQYTFSSSFNLANPASAVLNINWSIDDNGILLLNGVPIASGNGTYGAFQNVTVTGSSGLFIAGTNTLSVTMTSSDSQYDGIRVLGTVSEQGAITPAAGTFLPSTVTANFTTGASIDTDSPSIAAMTPPNGASTGVGTNVVLRVVYAEPMDPVSSTNWYLYDNNAGRYVPLSVTWSQNLTTLTFSYASYTNSTGQLGTLNPNTNYTFCPGAVYDFVGNQAPNSCVNFTTGPGKVTAALDFNHATPQPGQTGVPLNAVISFHWLAPMDATSVQISGIQFSPALAGTWSLSADGFTSTFTPSAPLAQNTQYTLSVAPGSLQDINGNAELGDTITFTTGGSAFAGNGTISLTSPAQGSTGVSVTGPIAITLSRPVDTLSINRQSFMVCVFNNCNLPAAGNLAASPDGTHLSFTPVGALPANTHMAVYAGWNAPLYDLAGIQFSQLYGADFTTGPNASPITPSVMNISPPSNAFGVGPNATVTLNFNEALSASTINSTNFALYNGQQNLGASVTYSIDRHTVFLNATLPYSSVITVSVGTGVQDISGTPMAAAFTSSFTTVARPFSGNGSVVQMRPANGSSGIPLTAPITLYTSLPIAANTANSQTVVVLANGVAVPGTVSVGSAPATSEGQTIVFTPTNPYPAGAFVQIFASNAVTDKQGNPINGFNGSFTTVAAASDPTVIGPTVIASTGGGGEPVNGVVVVTFDQPINPATVSPSNFYVELNNTGAHLAVSVTQIQPNILVLNPGPMQANSSYYIYLTPGLSNLDGLPVVGASSTQFHGSFSTNTSSNATLPAVQFTGPTDGATGIGDNANPAIVLNELAATQTINSQSIIVLANGNPVPFTMNFGTLYNQNTQTSFVIYPYLPFPDNATITVKISVGGSIVDYSGNILPEKDITFQTGAGPDFTNPAAVQINPQPNLENTIPTNTVFTFRYNEPLAPYITSNPQIANLVYDYGTNSYIPANLTLSPDGQTITLAPTLTAGTQYSVCAPAVYDLAGNQGGQTCATYTVANTPSGTPLVAYTTPIAGATNVPTNGVLDIGFNEPVDNQSLGQITLTPTAPSGPAVPIEASLIYDGTVVRLSPNALLAANTTYQVSIAGVTDLSGTNTVVTQSFSFTTGAGPQIGSQTGYTSVQVSLSGGGTAGLTPQSNPGVTNVDGTQAITAGFTGPVEQASIVPGNGIRMFTVIGNTPVPITVTLTNNGTTAMVTPIGNLAAGTQYILYLNWGVALYDQVGNSLNNAAYFYFTTH
ncbi:MAG TPA: Ig-like domain-containing protein [Terriglobales bacterium]|nr:Ig-like domain-containing protein [Terriglobales bacterium]